MEIPSPPEHLVRELQQFDPRLELRFDPDERLWQVREQLRGGVYSHVFFWHDGPYNGREFRRLPSGANPLLKQLQKADLARYHKKAGTWKLRDTELSAKRVKAVERNKVAWKEKYAEYARVMKSKGNDWARKYRMGGYSRKVAVQARAEAFQEIFQSD